MASGAAIGVAVKILMILPGTADVSFADILSVIKHSDAADSGKKIIVLNIITIVIGSIMIIVILLSLILKLKQSMFFAVFVSVKIIIMLLLSIKFNLPLPNS